MSVIVNGRWDEEDFEEERRQVLAKWPTGEDVDFEEACEYLRKLPESKIAYNKFVNAVEEEITMVQPRAGIAPLEAFIDMLLMLQDYGGADLLPVTVDSETRHHRYEKAEEGIKASEKTGKSALNGFPGGVTGCRTLQEAVSVPLELRPAAPDMRFCAEIGFAAGFTAALAGAIVNGLQHHKDIEPERAIRCHQYVHRLAAKYEEQGIPMVLEMGNYMSTVLTPPGLSAAVVALESLIATEQGVKNLIVGSSFSGHVFQDITNLHATHKVCRTYLDTFGYGDVSLFLDYGGWVGRFPDDAPRSYALICQFAMTAALANAQMIMSKSIQEGRYLPAKDANAAAVRATKQVLGIMRRQKLHLSEEWQDEKETYEAEARAIVDRVIQLGDGNVALGAAKAIHAGVIDVPFAPNIHNKGKLMPIRDHTGAVRILDPGNLPLSEKMLAYHRKKLERREQEEGRKLDYLMTLGDILGISKGTLVGKKEDLVASG